MKNFKEIIQKKLKRGVFVVAPIIGLFAGLLLEYSFTFSEFIGYTLFIGVPSYFLSLRGLNKVIHKVRMLR